MKKVFIILLYLFISDGFAFIFSKEDISNLKQNLIRNISEEGAVMASPSRYYPNYYFDWVRDAAITMDLVESWYEQDHHPADKTRLINYVYWVEKAQRQIPSFPNQDILGEPKFYLDGHVYEGPWGRPQNDGPALRALTLIRFAKELIRNNESDFVAKHLYTRSLDTQAMGAIKLDLEYIAHHWQEKNFDLWEEVYGDHFFTTLVQYKALLAGALLASQLKDSEAAHYYKLQTALMEKRLKEHLDTQSSLITATLTPHPGPQKSLELDSAVVLAVLLHPNYNDFFTITNHYLSNTVEALKEQFKALYPINAHHSNALLFGRYPGDTYDGYQSEGQGNPWFILTAMMAEYHYSLASHYLAIQNQAIAVENIHQGDAYLILVKAYAKDLSLSEQINRITGLRQGAISLTWSYAAVLRAVMLREGLIMEAKNKKLSIKV